MVSVVIPTYNRGFCVVESINSVLEQTYQDFEIIIVDDCSADDTEERIAALDNPKIRYIRTETNQGAGGARNIGVAAARGEYIAFQDSDDLWLPDKLRLQMEHITETKTDMNFTQFITKGNNLINEPLYEEICKYMPNIFNLLLYVPFIGAPTILCKKSCFDELGGFDANLTCLEDYDFVLRFAEKYNISYVHKTLLIARCLDIGLNSNWNKQLKVQHLLFKKYFSQILKNGYVNEWVRRIELMARRCSPKLQLEVYMSIKEIIQDANID